MASNVKSINEIKIPEEYEFIQEKYLSDCKGMGLVFKHKKSGARICVISNDDNNKVFCIGFRTPAKDNTGVAHILEHSVLCGSEKYPVKDPFMELEKGSLNTFMNAITYPDKTCYPVASCNDKDFDNLMGVYLDAVFFPLIYKRPEIFRQEGWHFETEGKGSPLTVNGIVFNEMKGAFSSPESRIMRDAVRDIFPDISYRYDAGGMPESIPDLTYENFLDFHRSYYHPSNSFIYLYGDIDIESKLKMMDREYLSRFEYRYIDSEIGIQSPVGVMEKEGVYPLGKNESEEKAGFLTWTTIAGAGSEVERLIAISVILDVLFEIPGAPVKEALEAAGVGQNIGTMTDNDLKQSLIVVIAENADPEKMPEFKRILREELEKAADGGLNKNSLRAVLNRMAFAEAEADFKSTPKGLVYIMNSMSTWYYDENDPFSALNKQEIYAKLKGLIDTGYFEKVLREVFLEGESSVYTITRASKELGEEEERNFSEKLEKYRSRLTDEDIEKIISDNEALKKYHDEPSSPEALLSIPVLSREDISQAHRQVICDEDSVEGIKLYLHDFETNNIVYLSFCFDLGGIPEDKLYLLPILNRCLGSMDTKNYSYLELNNEINMHTGGFGTDVVTFPRRGNSRYYRPVLMFEAFVMKDELPNVKKYIKEYLFETRFESVKRLRDLLGEERTELKVALNGGGHSVAISSVRENVSPEFTFLSRISGLNEYRFCDKAVNYSDEEIAGLLKNIGELCGGIVGKDNMFIDVTCNRNIYGEIKGTIEEIVSSFEVTDGSCKVKDDRSGIDFECRVVRRAYTNSGTVNYVAAYGEYGDISEEMRGKMMVASQIISNEHLYENIRGKGGAYGCGFIANAYGNTAGFYSYRDPHVMETYDIYRRTVDFLENYQTSDRELLKAVIGTIGILDTPITPHTAGRYSLRYFLGGATDEMFAEHRRGIVSTTQEDIRSMAKYVKKILEADNYCVVGSEKAIEKNRESFDSVESLL